MKNSHPSSNNGFTLVELLVVIAIIGILAALLLPVIHVGQTRAKKTMARAQMAQIVTAIYDYQQAINVFPIGNTSQAAALAGGGDFTYGATFATPTGVPADVQSYGAVVMNSEIMGVLLDLESFPNGSPTINPGHIKNPKKQSYLHGNSAGDTKSPGLGLDGVYRDPWGDPYVITFDVNADEKTRDGFYSDPRVSGDPSNPNAGLQGLVKRTLPSGASVFECPAPVTVWSAGPDKMVDPNLGNSPSAKANKGANKDNILSWQ
jgi:prepilin-type N-terminal cleavage/methylation domain-containing protein